MSGSLMPGPSAMSRRRAVRSRLWLLMVVCSIWVRGNYSMPGPGRRGSGPISCEECSKQALEQADGSYKCPNGHRFFPSRAGGRKKGKKRK
jgi:hypothetical protein